MTRCVDVSVVIATRNRAASLTAMLNSLAEQPTIPSEIIIVDGSDNPAAARNAFGGVPLPGDCELKYVSAELIGAAQQRNQGVPLATRSLIWFIDDDVIFESDCAKLLFEVLQVDRQLGGVNAMIVNQRYQPPGIITRLIFTLLHGKNEKSFAGKIIGPAVNLLPEDRDDLPEVARVEWLNTTCTMYRREALPSPTFDSQFTDYSFMEDLALSLRVTQRGWKLANVRKAKIFHASQSGKNNSDVAKLSAMELQNRHYIMTQVLNNRSIPDYAKLLVWELFQLGSSAATSRSWVSLKAQVAGKLNAVRQIVKNV